MHPLPTPASRLLLAALLLCACEPVSPSPSLSGPASEAPSAEDTPGESRSAYDGLWVGATADTIGTTADWTNKVEVADLNQDGLPDLLFSNGGDYESPGTPVASRVFLNGGPGQRFTDATESVLGDLVGLTRVMKARDLNGDGWPEIVLGTTYQTQSQLVLANGDGTWALATDRLPQLLLSVGDLEIGDVDADGDLDMVLADWGSGSPMSNQGGRVYLWLNDGTGRFTDVSEAQMPATRIRFGWELELVDVDNDWDLDVAISSKLSSGSFLFENDGAGAFTDVTAGRMPQFTNNYEFEAMDLDGDGFLDLVTINDGDNAKEHVFRNEGGTFVDATEDWWPAEANPGADDNVIVFLDADADGDADFLVGSLDGRDRLLVNDGSGHLSLESAVFNAAPSRGTLGMAVADFNGDGRLDVVESQGEHPSDHDERVYLATDRFAPDTVPPSITTDLVAGASGPMTIHARVHDWKSPLIDGDLFRVEIVWDGASAPGTGMAWYGEYLFAVSLEIPADATGLQVCATDRAGNEACAPAG